MKAFLVHISAEDYPAIIEGHEVVLETEEDECTIMLYEDEVWELVHEQQVETICRETERDIVLIYDPESDD